MIEVLWHGRGGQGAFTAAKLLGAAYVAGSGQRHALAFPSFGPERRGAPVRAFTKLDERPINNRSEIRKSDFIVFLDDTLFTLDALDGLKPGGKVLLNTRKHFPDERVLALDAERIALECLKMPIANTVMMGALSALLDGVELTDLESAIARAMPPRIAPGNIAAVRAAREAVAAG